MAVLKKIKSHPHVVGYFKKLPFYIGHIEKPKFKRLKNIDLLSELPFYEELNVIKTDHAFRGYAMSYKVEIVEKKDPLIQLEASKTSMKDLCQDLLDETKGLKYQMTLKVELKKYNSDGEIEFTSVYFNSATKIVISHNLVLKKLFKKSRTGLITGLMKNLVGLLKQSSLNTLTFQLTDHYEEVLV